MMLMLMLMMELELELELDSNSGLDLLSSLKLQSEIRGAWRIEIKLSEFSVDLARVRPMGR